MSNSVGYAIGVDLGATFVKTLAVARDGSIMAERVDPTEDGAAMRWAANVRLAISNLEKELGSSATAVGICAPGLIDPDGRAVAWMSGRMESTVGFDWTGFLERERVVPVLNDGQAALLGEVWQGAARGARNVVMVTLGTGVGGGILADGRLLRGHIGRAGHVGHMTVDASGRPDVCGMPGGLDDLLGDATVARRSGGRFNDTTALVAAHVGGDAEATALWLEQVHYLACGVASLINLIDPEIVVIGGGIARAGKALFEPLTQALDRIEWRPNGHQVTIVPARLGTHAGALGAARNALVHASGEAP